MGEDRTTKLAKYLELPILRFVSGNLLMLRTLYISIARLEVSSRYIEVGELLQATY